MPVVEIETLLQNKMGLEISSIGHSSLNRALCRRMKSLSVTNKEVYINKLKSSSKELNELIEEVVVPETWFFRDKQPFKALTRHAQLTLAKNNGHILRILSAPCSTGEEAYSVAMTLIEAGISQDLFVIYAMDISKRSLEKAKKGEYRNNSFREKDVKTREKYFHQTDDNTFLLNESIRKKVRFFNGNLLDSSFMEGLGIFDILLCRNVLIYLDKRSRELALKNLECMLAMDGLLFVGHAESGLLSQDRFKQSIFPNAFAFRKIDPTECKNNSHSIHSDRVNTTPLKTSPHALKRRKKSYSSILAKSYKYSTTTKPIKTPKPSVTEKIINARLLADEGRHKEAAELCKKYLTLHGPSAEAYFLLGMIQDEAGNPCEAAKLLRKSVYLEPNHKDALLLLSLLAEKSGDVGKAKIFKDRLERIPT